MRPEDFDYPLSQEMIAFHSLKKRDECRLLVVNRDEETIEHKKFCDLPEFLKSGDLLILNDTKVIPARLFGKSESGRELDILLIERNSPKTWKCLLKNPKHGMNIKFENELKARLQRKGSSDWLIEFEKDADDHINSHGKMPLPPYITREPLDEDKVLYQTVYAKNEGAIAAPTSGLHFTEGLLDEIRKKGIEIKYITLHIGIGTFRPVRTDNIEDHAMETEYRVISEETAKAINKAKNEGRRVIACGTTVVRALESGFRDVEGLEPDCGYTDLFIYPGFKFKVVDALITNFHLPRSTLIMLVTAFAGRELIFKAYEVAKEEGYRFLSYGDPMFIV